jgi:Notch-like protein
MPLFSECIQSDNYLMGCDSTLSEKLCVRQIGTVLGELAQCVFKDNCHSIPDPNYAKCSDTVTRSGCLSISNKE